jgi:nucleoside-diphosphate-sugar epimerase
MTTAVITGGTGFIGRRVACRLLDEGWTVGLLTRPSSTVPTELDGRVHRLTLDGNLVNTTSALRDFAPDVVLHLASMIVVDHEPEQAAELLRSNIEMPVLVTEAAIAAGCRAFVNTGTFWQHFEGRDYWPVDLYAATKQAFEALLLHYVDRHALHAVTLTLFDSYGRNDVRRKIVGLLVDAAMTGQPLGLSPGDQILDLTHVDDIAEAFLVAALRALEPRPVSERFFVSGERITLRALVSAVERLSGPAPNIKLGARPYRAREIMDPVHPTDNVLPGWSPRISLNDELARSFAVCD